MFWPNRGFQCLRSQNGPTGLKSSPYREYSALSMKSEQKSLSRSCGARFGKMAISSAKNRTLVLLAFTGYKSSSSQENSALFRKGAQERTFKAALSTFRTNGTLQPSRFQNGRTGLISSPYRECSAFFMKGAQNSLFRPWAHLLAKSHFPAPQIQKWSYKFQIVPKSEKQYPWVRPWEHVLTKSLFLAPQISK